MEGEAEGLPASVSGTGLRLTSPREVWMCPQVEGRQASFFFSFLDFFFFYFLMMKHPADSKVERRMKNLHTSFTPTRQHKSAHHGDARSKPTGGPRAPPSLSDPRTGTFPPCSAISWDFSLYPSPCHWKALCPDETPTHAHRALWKGPASPWRQPQNRWHGRE